MRLFYKNEWIVAGVCGVAVAVGAHLGLSERFGASPDWPVQVAYLGVALGILLEFFIVQERGWLLAKSVVIAAFTAVSLMVATIARGQFHYTHDQDVLAYGMWYLGAVGVAAGIFMALFLIFATAICKRGR